MSLIVVREIGRGGFGVVEEMKDRKGKRYARKTFSPSVAIPQVDHEKLRKRFKREVTIQSELGGNEILQVIDSDLEGPTPWFLMPLAEMSYDEKIMTDKRDGTVDILAITDILNGLHYLHEHGYVHRDLNPKNILLHKGTWKLSDLGAVLPPTGKTVTLTEDTVIYTEQYCSPEQRIDFHSAQASADIYAFGCILHDIFGVPPRTPYAKHHAQGAIGIIIEKCTEPRPDKRPSIGVLREIVLETLIESSDYCQIDNHQAEAWLARLSEADQWPESVHNDFARFFNDLNVSERLKGHETDWVDSASTPFMTKFPLKAMKYIASRQDGLSTKIVEKYCQWAGDTAFRFEFSDLVCMRLGIIFDAGTPANKASAIIAMARLGSSHHRFFIMREMLKRCSDDSLPKELAKRFAIEIKTEEIIPQFSNCVEIIKWDISELPEELAKICG